MAIARGAVLIRQWRVPKNYVKAGYGTVVESRFRKVFRSEFTHDRLN